MYVILSCSLVGVMGVSMVSPVLPELRNVFGVTDSEVGLVITAYTLPGVFLTPFMGLVADRVGRRRVVVPLLFVFGVSGASIAFVSEFWAIIALRLAQGVGASGLITLSITLIGDLYEGPQRNAVLGLNGSTISAGAAFYPLLGGSLAVIRWEVPFLFFGVAVGMGTVAAAALPEPDGIEPTATREYIGRLGDVLTDSTSLWLYAATFSALFIYYGSVLTSVPLVLNAEFGLGSGAIGPILSVTALSAAVVSSRYEGIASYVDSRRLVALGFCAYGLALLGLWVAPSPLAVALVLVVFGGGNVVTLLSIDASIMSIAPDDLRAGMMGLRTSAFRLGQTVGPAAFTATAPAVGASKVAGYRTVFAVFGVLSVTVGAVAYAWLRR